MSNNLKSNEEKCKENVSIDNPQIKKRRIQHPYDYKIKVTYADNDLTLYDLLDGEEFREFVRKILLKH